jgi:hypothetical protein
MYSKYGERSANTAAMKDTSSAAKAILASFVVRTYKRKALSKIKTRTAPIVYGAILGFM